MNELLLLSGGIDSTAIAVLKRPAIALTVDYGQRAAPGEITAAKAICTELGISHVVLAVPLSSIGQGLMAGGTRSVLSEREEFWPFRNQLLLTIGAMYAASNSLTRVLIGTVATDVRHRDGSRSFLRAMHELISSQEGGIEIQAPGINEDTLSLVRRAQVPASVLGWTHSCHAGSLACGACPGCVKHSEIMEALGWSR
ncbi:7-cyano-7-deazaguanine synthase [Luteimonas gilva]|uniref:7-cyano-7-deazaguanine synthase n=1 Tax=Luteimonas gilva TaxID=2572684 RepID=A0A4U5JNZ0_9GAMM|nr:7-cyano-7-deazaguanine synthase [Luteimonas gilva]TKR30271.1 7-cyano-7-deazaguanine synthase [Luteimonas gilva]